MKKYIIILLVLISIGVGLSYVTVRQNMLFDDGVFLNTTESVRNLKLLDNKINILLFNTRYKNDENYEELESLTIDLSDEFDNLRYEALFEEIESSTSLSDATINFEQELRVKLEDIENFINSHQLLVEASDLFSEDTNPDAEINQVTEKLSLQEEIVSVNINFYRYLQNKNDVSKTALNDDISRIAGMIEDNTEDDQAVIFGYIKTLTDVIIHSDEMQEHFDLATGRLTEERLNQFESAYVNFHNDEIAKAGKLRNALILYGLVLLLVVIFFVYLLRKHYASLEQEVADRTYEIQQTLIDLKESQEQLVQSEKMASLGELVAGVAHEINTPLGYVHSNVETVKLNFADVNEVMKYIKAIYKEARSPNRSNKKLSALLSKTLATYKEVEANEVFEESQQLLDDSSHGLDEISHLVKSLKDFSRLDRQSSDQIDVHDCIKNSLKIGASHIKSNDVTVQENYADLPKIICMPSKLNQLFLNIITNASQAMKDKGGLLTIETAQMQNSIIITFTDEGIGMDQETSKKMFDPFFTTKPIGEGTGLGMSIAYKIVEEHKGHISAQSELGKGTTITVELPQG